MSNESEIRYFPIPKNLKEMTSDQKKEYATQLVDHMLKQGNEVIKKKELSRWRRILQGIFNSVAIAGALFFYFISSLQFNDQYIDYGFVSIGLGTTCLALPFAAKYLRKIRERKKQK
jgi:hypothetical protein